MRRGTDTRLNAAFECWWTSEHDDAFTRTQNQTFDCKESNVATKELHLEQKPKSLKHSIEKYLLRFFFSSRIHNKNKSILTCLFKRKWWVLLFWFRFCLSPRRSLIPIFWKIIRNIFWLFGLLFLFHHLPLFGSSCLVRLSLMHEMHKKSEHNEIKTVYVCVYEYGYSLHRLWESTQQRQNQTRYTKACTPKSPCTRNGSNVHIYSGEWTEDKTRRNETKHMKGRRRELEKWTEWKTAEKMS